MWYKEEQKQRYLKTCNYEEVTKPVIETIFNACEPVERSNKKDISEFSMDEIVDFLKKMNANSRGYLNTACSYLENYYTWCLRQGLISDVDNKFSIENTKLIIESIIPKERLDNRYFNKTQLLIYLKKIYAPENKFIVYSFFLGITEEELVNIKESDVNKEDMCVYLFTGRTLTVDRLWMNLMELTHTQEYYDSDGKLNSSNRRIDLYFYNKSEYVLKYTIRNDNKPLASTVITTRMRTIKKQTENEYLSVRNIQVNGLVNYIKDKYYEQGITLESAITDKYNQRSTVYDKETQKYIEEFGSTILARVLRREISEHLDCFM